MIIWYSIIELGKNITSDIIFVSNDEKADWVVKSNHESIVARYELVAEFHRKTGKKFSIISFPQFIQLQGVDEEIISELKAVKNRASIEVSQRILAQTDELQEGVLFVTLNRPMKYATATGKFRPMFPSIPEFEVSFLNSPRDNIGNVELRWGCGTTRDFNVHIKALNGLLEPGEYEFRYSAHIKEYYDEASHSGSCNFEEI